MHTRIKHNNKQYVLEAISSHRSSDKVMFEGNRYVFEGFGGFGRYGKDVRPELAYRYSGDASGIDQELMQSYWNQISNVETIYAKSSSFEGHFDIGYLKGQYYLLVSLELPEQESGVIMRVDGPAYPLSSPDSLPELVAKAKSSVEQACVTASQLYRAGMDKLEKEISSAIKGNSQSTM